MKLSTGSRSFLRYGYGDLLREDRRWGVLHRIWPGTQRLLIWGDPLTAAAHSRAFSFCGSDGVEIMEPLSFKGRRGSGLPGDRARLRRRLAASRAGIGRSTLTRHRVWGRLLYNPDADPDTLAALSAQAVRRGRAGRREAPWPMPAASCPSSPPLTAPRPATTPTGRRCT